MDRPVVIHCFGLRRHWPARGAETLPLSTVFKGDDKFEAVKRRARSSRIGPSYPIGQRVAIAGRALLNTRYKGYTLEIDNHIEAPSVNFTGLDCWTFFETSLALARMVGEPKENWTEQTLLKYIEMDRYRGGQCDGTYLSRLHYLEDWYFDNSKRGLIQDLTRDLGGVRVPPHSADEMSLHWRSYRCIWRRIRRCGRGFMRDGAAGFAHGAVSNPEVARGGDRAANPHGGYYWDYDDRPGRHRGLRTSGLRIARRTAFYISCTRRRQVITGARCWIRGSAIIFIATRTTPASWWGARSNKQDKTGLTYRLIFSAGVHIKNIKNIKAMQIFY